MDLISVVVPVYNVENYLLRCVESIQKQTYKNLEIILVDDGSPDNCPKMCDELAQNDERIKVIHKENGGQGLARNDGMNIATGEYITFVDSDDWISLNHIENLYNSLKKRDAEIVIGNHTRAFANGERQVKKISLEKEFYKEEEVITELLIPLLGGKSTDSQDIIINSSVSMSMYSLELIRKHNIQFVSERFAVAEDFYFNIDVFYHCKKVSYCRDEVGYFYFENFQSTCEKYNPKRFERTINYYNLICERMKEYGLSDLAEFRVERGFLMKIRVAIRHIVMSELSRKEKQQQIGQILSNSTVKDVLKKYPISAYGFSIKTLTKMMKENNVRGVYYLMLLRERGRNKKLTGRVMAFFGLSR